MIEKKSVLKFEDYVEPKHHNHTAYHPSNPYFKSLTQFKLDRIFPRHINVKLRLDAKENFEGLDLQHLGRSSPHFRLLTVGENRFYHQYLNVKDQQKANIRKTKMSHIFNIKSINLIEKMKQDKEKVELEKNKCKQKYSSKDVKRNVTEKAEKENYKELNLILVDKKSHSPQIQHRKINLEKKNSVCNLQRVTENKSIVLQKNTDSFENKLVEYCQYLKENCQCHGLTLKEVENYSKNSIVLFVGRGNNGHLIKELAKKRWWWTLTDDKTKRYPNFMWTQLKQKSFYVKKQSRSQSTASQYIPRRSESQGKSRQDTRQGSNIADNLNEISELQIHNHFENNEFLGNKKALYYNMKAYYQKQGKNVFDYLPVTFHVKRYQDQAWKDFSKYYFEDAKKHEGERRLWIVKPGENSNRGNGITIHSDYQKISKLVETEISGSNNSKKTFIIQKYIDKPFLYNKRKFDIRCYMLLVRLNGKIKGYWCNQGYIRTSCYEYQIQDTNNEFIHLTNDAIQVNCDKYGKYEDGNKLSYHNFQKYLDHNHKGSYRFVEDICPQLKKIATDSIEATYHLLGDWNGLPTFEIFGLDFMIDEHFKPWLIEINTNPCLQTSSTTLERVIPRMIDNAFKLSIDLLFPPPQNWLNSKKHFLPNRVSNSPFELVFDESKMCGGLLSNDIILQMGEIEQENQIYGQKYGKDYVQGGKDTIDAENE